MIDWASLALTRIPTVSARVAERRIERESKSERAKPRAYPL
jgi:hypothetical protein